METELAGQLQEGRRPEWLSGAIPPARHGLHVVEDEHPWHPAEREETVDEAAEQRLLAHIGAKNAVPAEIGLLGIGARQFEHPLRGQAVADPLLDLCTIRVHMGATLPPRRLSIHGLMQRTGNGRRAPRQLIRDLPDALAA